MWRKDIRTVVVQYFGFHFLRAMHLFASVTSIFYQQWGGVSKADMLNIQSYYMLASFVFEIPTGVFADRIGRKRSLMLGCAISGLGMLYYGTHPGYWHFAFAEVVLAFGNSFITGADSAILYAQLEQKGCTELTGLFAERTNMIRRLGGITGAVIATLLVPYFGLGFVMIGTGIAYALAGVLIARFPEVHTHRQRGSVTYVGKAWRVIWSQKEVRTLWLSALLGAPAGYYLIWMYQTYILDMGLSEEAFGGYYILLSLAQVVLGLVVSYLICLSGGMHRYYFMTAMLTSVSFVLAGLFPSQAMLVVLVLVGAFTLTRSSPLMDNTVHFIPQEVRSTARSIFESLNTLVFAVLNVFMGLLMERSVFLALIVVGLLPLMTLFFPLSAELFRKNEVDK